MACIVVDQMPLKSSRVWSDRITSGVSSLGWDCQETLQLRVTGAEQTLCWSATAPATTYDTNPLDSSILTLDGSSTLTETGSSFSSSKDTSEPEDKQKSTLQAICDLQSTSQNRVQLLQRFYDLHIGTSKTARRLFAYEELDLGDFHKVATTASMDAL